MNKIIKLCSDPQPVQPVLVLALHLQHCHQAGLTFSPSYRLTDMKMTESSPLTYITCDQNKLARSSRVTPPPPPPSIPTLLPGIAPPLDPSSPAGSSPSLPAGGPPQPSYIISVSPPTLPVPHAVHENDLIYFCEVYNVYHVLSVE